MKGAIVALISKSFCQIALLIFLAAALLGGTLGCSTYQSKVHEARTAFANHSPSQAAQLLEPLANKESNDQLVYLLDYATALQQAGRFKESAYAFSRAERIADIQDYHSLTRVTGSLLLSEEMIQYKGDAYEKVLINGLNAVNYLEMGDLDGALVEVRRLNQKLYQYKYEAKREYEQNPFAYYISAVIWEADKKWDDAYIAYHDAYKLMPDYLPLREDLIRAAIKADRPEELAKWKKQFPEVQIRPEWKDKSLGEIVFIYQQGWGPRKRSRPENPRFPKLYPTSATTIQAQLLVSEAPEKIVKTTPIFSVEEVAIKTLEDDYARLVASRVAGIATKAVMADQIRQKNEALGHIAWLAMNLADQADLRQWSTLPKTFQIARVYVKPGKYKIKANGLDYNGQPTGEVMTEREVEIKAGKKAFISWRSVQ